MNYIVGIDGGGTKTVMRAADTAGNLLCRVEGRTTNINSARAEYVAGVLREMTAQVLGELCETAENCRFVCVGAAGVDRDGEKRIMSGLLRQVGYECPIHITNDGIIALWEGANGEGIVVESGTGSICYGRNHQGGVCRAGGWGHIIGDEGSAYGIAVKALNRISRSADGRDGPTALTEFVLQQLGLADTDGLISWVYRSGKGKTEIAQIAKAVDQAADAEDEMALRILRDAARELVLCAAPVIQKLGFENTAFTTVTAGSILLKSPYVSRLFLESMKRRYPLTEFKELNGKDAASGAVLLALHLLNDGND